MYEKELFSIKDMLNIKKHKFSIVLDRDYKNNKTKIVESISAINNKYKNNIYYITSKVLLEHPIFVDVNTYPAIFMFSYGKGEPDYFLPGVIK